MRNSALLIIDMQNDFCPGGALAVPEADKIIGPLNRYSEHFRQQGMPVLVSRDWHPLDSKQFKDNGGPWPVHCVQNTKGAEFPSTLRMRGAVIFSKGQDPAKDGYSVLEAQTDKQETFNQYLKRFRIEALYVGGVATEYCVKSSVLDMLRHGYKVFLLIDAVKGIDAPEARTAMDNMIRAGGKRTSFLEFTREESDDDG